MKALERLIGLTILGIAWLTVAGCGGSQPAIITGNQPVHGQVLDADDKPVSGGTVTFVGSSAPGSTVIGKIGQDGNFTMETQTATATEPGVVAAATPYAVYVKLADGVTSYHLKKQFKVKEGDNEFSIKLTREAYYP